MWKEIALGIAEVRAIEPDIGLIEDAVQGDPSTRAVARGVGTEAMSVHHRTIAGGKLRSVAPVPWHDDRFPGRVVGVELDAVPTDVVVRLDRDPATV